MRLAFIYLNLENVFSANYNGNFTVFYESYLFHHQWAWQFIYLNLEIDALSLLNYGDKCNCLTLLFSLHTSTG